MFEYNLVALKPLPLTGHPELGLLEGSVVQGQFGVQHFAIVLLCVQPLVLLFEFVYCLEVGLLLFYRTRIHFQ